MATAVGAAGLGWSWVEPAETEELRQRARESDQCIRSSWGRLSKASMHIGWEAAFLKRHNLWQVVGFPDEKGYREDVGVSRSTWYENVRIAEAFVHLDKDTYLKMSIENANHLSGKPEEIRYDPTLLEQAASLSSVQFEDAVLVDHALRENRDPDQSRTTLKLQLSRLQKRVLLKKLHDWQQFHQIENPGYALELLVAEYADHATLVGFLVESLTRIALAVKSPDDLRAFLATYVGDIQEILDICGGQSTPC